MSYKKDQCMWYSKATNHGSNVSFYRNQNMKWDVNSQKIGMNFICWPLIGGYLKTCQKSGCRVTQTSVADVSVNQFATFFWKWKKHFFLTLWIVILVFFFRNFGTSSSRNLNHGNLKYPELGNWGISLRVCLPREGVFPDQGVFPVGLVVQNTNDV